MLVLARHAFLLMTLVSLTGSLNAGEAKNTPEVLLPDALGKAWVKALRENDLTAGYQLVPPKDQARLESTYTQHSKKIDVVNDIPINVLLNLARQDNGAAQLTALAQPHIISFDPQAISAKIKEATNLVTMAASTQKPGSTSALDYAGIKQWLEDVAAFIPTAGFNDPQKLQKAMTHVVAACKASGFIDAQQIRATPFPELIKRLSPVLPELKKIGTLYDMNIDALLDSFKFSVTDVTSESATLTIAYTAFDKARSFPLKLVQRSGTWNLGEGNDNPLTGLSQLVMMGLLMHTMGQPAPQQPAPVNVNDGAL
jgi:flagellar motor switch/type III secretory pathway protein FliN